MAKIVSFGDFVGPGEQLTAAYLEANLPESWLIICNKELVAPKSVREVDFIIIGDDTIFLVEEKHWHGLITGNEAFWVLDGNESRRSPLRQIEEVGKRIDSLLRARIPRLSDFQGKVSQRRVLISVAETQLMIDDPRAPERVLRLDGCDDDLCRFDQQQAALSSICSVRDDIIRELTALPDRPAIPTQVSDYHIIEATEAIGDIRCLRARHRDGTERLLRLIPKPSTASPDAAKRQANALLREYDALKLLGDLNVAPNVDPYFSWDDDRYWVLPIHPVDGRSLNAEAVEAAPAQTRIAAVILAALESLKRVHETGTLHRALDPDCIVVTSADLVILTEFMLARLEDSETIVDDAVGSPVDALYTAPECLEDLGAATPSSDIYALGASLRSWVVAGQAGSPDEQLSVADLRADLARPFLTKLNAVLDACTEADPADRVSIDEAIEFARDLIAGTEIISQPVQLHLTGFEDGTMLDDQHRIVRRLGEGATAITYLAFDTAAEDHCVLKCIKLPELAARLARVEFRFLKDIKHKNLAHVRDIRPPSHRFHLKLDYIDGPSLAAIHGQLVGNSPAVLRIAYDVLEGLQYIHSLGRMHRDISPNNIVVPEAEDVCLIDFGLATVVTETTSAVGTPRYRAPEMDRGGTWTSSADLYSAAVVFYEALTGRLPYDSSSENIDKASLVDITDSDADRFGRPLLVALLKCADPNPEERFATAAEFSAALHAAADERQRISVVAGDARINPTVDLLRASYRNSKVGNSDNRGLDSEFAVETYVPTALDLQVLPMILEGRFQLVILSGNPGDGKTAFLQKLGAAIEGIAGHAITRDEAGWVATVGARTIAAVFDASESHGAKSADDLLHGALEPIAGDSPGDGSYTAVLAANDGRLLDFFDRYGAMNYGWLWRELRPQLAGTPAADSSVLLVDLKRRALAGFDATEPSLFTRIIDELVQPRRWSVCDGCEAREDCTILANVKTWQDQGLGQQPRQGLNDLLTATHLRRERRPTVRDLRSALGYVLTRDVGCADIHEERDSGSSPLAGRTGLYFNSVFDASGGPDLLLDAWRDLDPARTPVPRLDRFFYFHRHIEQSPELQSAFLRPDTRARVGVDKGDLDLDEWMSGLKRRYYFEGASSADRDDPNQLPAPRDLQPYRYLGPFLKALVGSHADPELLAWLLEGISLASGVPRAAISGSLALPATMSGSDDVVVIKRFPAGEFQLSRPVPDRIVGENFVDYLVLEHQSGAPKLLVNLDLFELIGRSGEGYLPGSEESRALGEDLQTFRNQLLARPTDEVTLVEGGLKLNRISVKNGNIVREQPA